MFISLSIRSQSYMKIKRVVYEISRAKKLKEKIIIQKKREKETEQKQKVLLLETEELSYNTCNNNKKMQYRYEQRAGRPFEF